MNRFLIALFAGGAAALLFAASCSKPPGQAEFDRGVYELKRENLVRARTLLEKSIARRPGSEQNALAYNYLGVAAWKLGQMQVAQDAFEDSRRISPTLAEPVYNLALLHRRSGDAAKAAQLLEQAAQINEKDPRPAEMLAQLYIERRQWPVARRILHAALTRAPNSPRILTALAVVDLHMRGPEKGVESHLMALEKDSRYAPALFNVGLIYETQLNDPDRARTYYKRFLAQRPEGPAADYARAALARPGEKQLVPPSEPPLAPLLPPEEPATPFTPPPVAPAPTQPPSPAPAPAPPPRTAEQTDDELIARASEQAGRGDARGALDTLLAAASEAGRAGRTPAREKLLRAATRVAFEEARAHIALADYLMEQGQFDQALRAYKQATSLDRQSFDAHHGVARAALKTGETDAALVGFTAAVRIDPRSPDALWDLARLHDEHLQDPERAIATYREFEKLFPTDPRTRRAAERIRALTPAVRAATPIPERRPPQNLPSSTARPAPAPAPVAPPSVTRPAPAPRPTQPPARQLDIRAPASRNTTAATAAFNQGTQLLAQRRWEQAVAAFRRAVENDDRHTSAFYNLGLAYTQLGDTDLAKDAYARALRLQPDLHSARFNLALLHFQTRDLATATTLAQDLVRQKPDYAVAHYLLGQIYSESADSLHQARAAYSRFLELAPNDPAAAVVRQWLATH
jgi:tetratricopeptide (TPR) repeat protein